MAIARLPSLTTKAAERQPTVKRRKRLKPEQKRQKVRDEIFTKDKDRVWNRKVYVGFTTVPRLLPLICGLIRALAENDPTKAYIDLWCWAYDEGVIENIDEERAAFSSGYTGSRGKRTWMEHMHELEKLGFIKIAENGNSVIGHVLIVNPLLVIDELHKKGKVKEEWWNSYVARAIEIGTVLPHEENDDED